MTVTILLILVIILTILSGIMLVVFSRLFLFVIKINENNKEIQEYVENLTDSVKEVIYEGYLKNDGRLKKNYIDKKNNPAIYNGQRLSESIAEDEIIEF